jgi:hypothetical protein
MKTPIYFNIVESSFACKCKACGITTDFENKIRFRYGDDNRVGYTVQCQCQACGSLKMSDYYTHPSDNLPTMPKCVCGGEFRRDKPLFCPSCKTEYWIEK